MTTWSVAFAAQAASDMDAYWLLAESSLPVSHRLHYLQMWLEKLSKTYLWMSEADAGELRFNHNVIAKVLPKIIQLNRQRLGVGERLDIQEIRQLCREIDRLHPQIDDDGRRLDNVEYPWLGTSEGIEIPARWKFSMARRLYSNPGLQLIKAATILTRNPAEFMY